MSTLDLPLTSLVPHPANANVMPERAFKKLIAHLDRTGRYPPLIVRPLPNDNPIDDAPKYQLLDGHHRAIALRRLGRDTARCVVWDVDDNEALLLLATLNRLQGRDDPRKRAELVHALTAAGATQTLQQLARSLPEDLPDLQRLLRLRETPPPAAPPALGTMPVAVHFFLLPDQKQRLESRLRQLGGSREDALMQLITR